MDGEAWDWEREVDEWDKEQSRVEEVVEEWEEEVEREGRCECEGECTNVTDEEWIQRVAEEAEIEHAVGCPEGDDGGERAWRGWVDGMRTGSVSDSDMDVLVTGRRRRVVTVVQWHAAARARMVIALGWVMHDRMARVSDWGVT